MLLVLSACRPEAPGENDPFDQVPDVIGDLQLSYIHTGLMTTFTAVFFTDENHGFLAGYHGDIYHTADGGITWETQTTPTDLPLSSLYFINEQEGYAMGGESSWVGYYDNPRGSIMLHTLDGGKNWQLVPIPDTQKGQISSICFTTDSVGYAVGGNTILTTRDRGKSWKETILTDLEAHMLDIEFSDPSTGLIGCTAGIVLRTVDGGQHWTSSTIANEHQQNRLSKVDNHTVFVCGSQYIGKSEDFGATWKGLPIDSDLIFTMNFKSDQLGYGFGMGVYTRGDFTKYCGAIYYTTNGGATWTINNKLTKIGVIDHSFFPTPDVGYAVSGNVVMKVERKK